MRFGKRHLFFGCDKMKFFFTFLLLVLLFDSPQGYNIKTPRGLNTTVQANFHGTYRRRIPCTDTEIETTTYTSSQEFHHHSQENNWNDYSSKCAVIIKSFLQALGNLVQFNNKQNGTFNFHINTSVSQKQNDSCGEQFPTILIEASDCDPPLISTCGSSGQQSLKHLPPKPEEPKCAKGLRGPNLKSEVEMISSYGRLPTATPITTTEYQQGVSPEFQGTGTRRSKNDLVDLTTCGQEQVSDFQGISTIKIELTPEDKFPPTFAPNERDSSPSKITETRNECGDIIEGGETTRNQEGKVTPNQYQSFRIGGQQPPTDNSKQLSIDNSSVGKPVNQESAKSLKKPQPVDLSFPTNPLPIQVPHVEPLSINSPRRPEITNPFPFITVEPDRDEVSSQTLVIKSPTKIQTGTSFGLSSHHGAVRPPPELVTSFPSPLMHTPPQHSIPLLKHSDNDKFKVEHSPVPNRHLTTGLTHDNEQSSPIAPVPVLGPAVSKQDARIKNPPALDKFQATSTPAAESLIIPSHPNLPEHPTANPHVLQHPFVSGIPSEDKAISTQQQTTTRPVHQEQNYPRNTEHTPDSHNLYRNIASTGVTPFHQSQSSPEEHLRKPLLDQPRPTSPKDPETRTFVTEPQPPLQHPDLHVNDKKMEQNFVHLGQTPDAESRLTDNAHPHELHRDVSPEQLNATHDMARLHPSPMVPNEAGEIPNQIHGAPPPTPQPNPKQDNRAATIDLTRNPQSLNFIPPGSQPPPDTPSLEFPPGYFPKHRGPMGDFGTNSQQNPNYANRYANEGGPESPDSDLRNRESYPQPESQDSFNRPYRQFPSEMRQGYQTDNPNEMSYPAFSGPNRAPESFPSDSSIDIRNQLPVPSYDNENFRNERGFERERVSFYPQNQNYPDPRLFYGPRTPYYENQPPLDFIRTGMNPQQYLTGAVPVKSLHDQTATTPPPLPNGKIGEKSVTDAHSDVQKTFIPPKPGQVLNETLITPMHNAPGLNSTQRAVGIGSSRGHSADNHASDSSAPVLQISESSPAAPKPPQNYPNTAQLLNFQNNQSPVPQDIAVDHPGEDNPNVPDNPHPLGFISNPTAAQPSHAFEDRHTQQSPNFSSTTTTTTTTSTEKVNPISHEKHIPTEQHTVPQLSSESVSPQFSSRAPSAPLQAGSPTPIMNHASESQQTQPHVPFAPSDQFRNPHPEIIQEPERPPPFADMNTRQNLPRFPDKRQHDDFRSTAHGVAPQQSFMPMHGGYLHSAGTPGQHPQQPLIEPGRRFYPGYPPNFPGNQMENTQLIPYDRQSEQVHINSPPLQYPPGIYPVDKPTDSRSNSVSEAHSLVKTGFPKQSRPNLSPPPSHVEKSNLTSPENVHEKIHKFLPPGSVESPHSLDHSEAHSVYTEEQNVQTKPQHTDRDFKTNVSTHTTTQVDHKLNNQPDVALSSRQTFTKPEMTILDSNTFREPSEPHSAQKFSEPVDNVPPQHRAIAAVKHDEHHSSSVPLPQPLMKHPDRLSHAVNPNAPSVPQHGGVTPPQNLVATSLIHSGGLHPSPVPQAMNHIGDKTQQHASNTLNLHQRPSGHEQTALIIHHPPTPDPNVSQKRNPFHNPSGHPSGFNGTPIQQTSIGTPNATPLLQAAAPQHFKNEALATPHPAPQVHEAPLNYNKHIAGAPVATPEGRRIHPHQQMAHEKVSTTTTTEISTGRVLSSHGQPQSDSLVKETTPLGGQSQEQTAVTAKQPIAHYPPVMQLPHLKHYENSASETQNQILITKPQPATLPVSPVNQQLAFADKHLNPDNKNQHHSTTHPLPEKNQSFETSAEGSSQSDRQPIHVPQGQPIGGSTPFHPIPHIATPTLVDHHQKLPTKTPNHVLTLQSEATKHHPHHPTDGHHLRHPMSGTDQPVISEAPPPPIGEHSHHSNPLLRAVETHLTSPLHGAIHGTEHVAHATAASPQHRPQNDVSVDSFVRQTKTEATARHDLNTAQPDSLVSDFPTLSNTSGEDYVTHLGHRSDGSTPLRCPFDPVFKGNMTAPFYYVLVSKLPVDDEYQIEKVYLGDGTPFDCTKGRLFPTSSHTQIPIKTLLPRPGDSAACPEL